MTEAKHTPLPLNLAHNMPENVWLAQSLAMYAAHQESSRREDVTKYVRSDVHDRIVAALDEVIELQGSALLLSKRAELIHAPEDALIKELCERIGYGAVMDSAARQWFLIDGTGCHTTYHCYGVVKDVTERAKQALLSAKAGA